MFFTWKLQANWKTEVQIIPDKNLEVKQSQGDVLDDFFRNIFGVEIGTEFELEGVLFLNILAQDFLV